MKTVMIVDDQVNVRLLIRDYLTQEGFRVVEAENGRQALLVARREMPDLILLDIMMPEMGGYDFLRAYRKEGTAPVILLTAKQEESDKVMEIKSWNYRVSLVSAIGAPGLWHIAFAL